jgi:G3E family GTPase
VLIPVNLVTGFLGSGKTTLLQRLLASPELSSAAVLVNEFGEVGLDHHLLERIDDAVVLLKSGCLCCTIRGDLRDSIQTLYDRRERGEIGAFDRLVIETTGLADPAPIVATLMADPVICHHFRLGNIVTVVAANNGRQMLAMYEESRKQVAVADRFFISKSDITAAEEVNRLRQELRRVNSTAVQLDGAQESVVAGLLTNDIYDPRSKHEEVMNWLSQEEGHGEEHWHYGHRHGGDISSFCITLETPLDWSAFALWLTMLINRHGENILRVKGMLQIAGVLSPVVIHGVQHTIHPPTHLDRWPDGNVGTRLVFIVKGLSRRRVEESLAAFNRLAAKG